MARYLLLHGFGGIGPDHWLVWLSTELRARGHVARIRKLPTPNAPDADVWLDTLAQRLTYLGAAGEVDGAAGLDEQGDPSGELVVVAHSLGGRLWLQHAQEAGDADGAYPYALADRVALVSPPILPSQFGHTRFHDLDVSKVDPSRAAHHTRVVLSGNDPYWPGGAAEHEFAAPLGAPVDHIGDHGHVEPQDGYGPWPGLLAWCVGEADAITA